MLLLVLLPLLPSERRDQDYDGWFFFTTLHFHSFDELVRLSTWMCDDESFENFILTLLLWCVSFSLSLFVFETLFFVICTPENAGNSLITHRDGTFIIIFSIGFYCDCCLLLLNSFKVNESKLSIMMPLLRTHLFNSQRKWIIL